ncbi:flagellar assembly protein FliW [Pelagibius sp.]|uniref:flagellar assembly protein FliW n=1 Tax=Pelagibius sp. TaxID=1931238 RepID=UPI0026262126|nr:flagellar assembly protein FliW [Pelagibius sp.]
MPHEHMAAKKAAPESPGAMASAPLSAGNDKKTIDTRFGTIEFDLAQALTFPKAIPGFVGYQTFGLAMVPSETQSSFMLLQALEPTDLSFIVLPYDPGAALIEPKDVESAQQHLGIAPGDCAIMLIATFRKIGSSFETSVNMRAPIFIDTANRLAWQYILPNDRYDVRHTL